MAFDDGKESLSFRALRNMPTGGYPLRKEVVEDMDGRKVEAVVWMWADERHCTRKAHFCLKTGRYIGDTF